MNSNEFSITLSSIEEILSLNPNLLPSIYHVIIDIINSSENSKNSNIILEKFLLNKIFEFTNDLSFNYDFNKCILKIISISFTRLTDEQKDNFLRQELIQLYKLSLHFEEEKLILIELYIHSVCSLLKNVNGDSFIRNKTLFNDILKLWLVSKTLPFQDLFSISFIPELLKNIHSEYRNELIELIWHHILFLINIKIEKDCLHRCTYLLCALCEYLFFNGTSEKYVQNLLLSTNGDFSVFQKAMLQEDKLIQKRTLYILNYVINLDKSQPSCDFKQTFKMDITNELPKPDSSNFLSTCKKIKEFLSIKAWPDLLLTLETLNETQFHMIEPTIKRIHWIKTCFDDVDESMRETCLYWVLVLYVRMFNHCSAQVRRFAVHRFFQDFQKHDLAICSKFFYSEFIDIFANSSIYTSNEEEDINIFKDVEIFIGSLHCTNINASELFVEKLFEKLELVNWNGCVLFVLSLGIKRLCLPNSITCGSTQNIKKFLGFNSCPIEASLRYAIRNNIFTFILMNIKKSNLSAYNLAVIISCFGEDFLFLFHQLEFQEIFCYILKCNNPTEPIFLDLNTINIKEILLNWLTDEQEIQIDKIEEVLNIDTCMNLMGILLLQIMSQKHKLSEHSNPTKFVEAQNTLDIEASNTLQNTEQIKKLELIRKIELNRTIDNYNHNSSNVFTDAGNVQISHDLEELLDELFGVLHRMARHVYLSTNLAIRALSMLIQLLRFTNYSNTEKKDAHKLDNRMFTPLINYMKKITNELCEDLLVFLKRILSSTNQDRRLCLYIICLLRELLLMDSLGSPIFIPILQKCLQQIFEENELKCESIWVLATFIKYKPQLLQRQQNILSIFTQQKFEINRKDFDLFETSKWLIISKLLRFYFNHQIDDQTEEQIDHRNMQEINQQSGQKFYQNIHLQLFDYDEEEISQICDMLLNGINTVPDECIIHCLNCLKYLIHKFEEDKRLILLEIFWQRILMMDSRGAHRSIMQYFFKTIFHKKNIFSFKLSLSSQKFLTDCLDICLEKYEEKPRMLIACLEPLLKKECLVGIVTKEFLFLLDYIIPILYAGSKPNKAARFLHKVEEIAYKQSLIPDPNLLSVDSKKARYTLYGCLLQLETDSSTIKLNPNQREIQHDGKLVNALLERLKEALDKSYKERYYGNSQIHVTRHRLLFVFLCLYKFLLIDADKWLNYFVGMLVLFDQPSVRFLIEWLIFIVGKHDEASFLYILDCLEKVDGGLPSQVGSLLYLVAQIAPYHSQHSVETLNLITQWSGVSNSSVRCQAQAALLFLSNICEQPSTSHLYKQALFINNHKKQHSGCFKLLMSYKYQINLEKDLNIQMIGCNVAREFNYADCLDIDYLVEIMRPMFVSNSCIPILSTNQQFEVLQNLKLVNINSDFAEINAETSTTNMFQKKMVPKKDLLGVSSLNNFENCTINSIRNETFEDEIDSFILIASLVTSPSNLGGLCRTCEVFGVNKLVVSNLDVFKHESFLSLSLTSQQWMPIQQIGETELTEYLIQLKLRGFKIFALEQTNNSHDLNNFNFPPRTALLLGNERSGINGRLLMLVDGCVEIHQSGIIRSLNVHVAAAIAIARYRATTPKIVHA